jgi:hypothetical protein
VPGPITAFKKRQKSRNIKGVSFSSEVWGFLQTYLVLAKFNFLQLQLSVSYLLSPGDLENPPSFLPHGTFYNMAVCSYKAGGDISLTLPV